MQTCDNVVKVFIEYLWRITFVPWKQRKLSPSKVKLYVILHVWLSPIRSLSPSYHTANSIYMSWVSDVVLQRCHGYLMQFYSVISCYNHVQINMQLTTTTHLCTLMVTLLLLLNNEPSASASTGGKYTLLYWMQCLCKLSVVSCPISLFNACWEWV